MDMKYRRSVMLNTMSLITNACTLLEVQRDHAGHGGGGGAILKGYAQNLSLSLHTSAMTITSFHSVRVSARLSCWLTFFFPPPQKKVFGFNFLKQLSSFFFFFFLLRGFLPISLCSGRTHAPISIKSSSPVNSFP